MAEIKPFRGIRYAWEDLSDEEMGRLVAPPYDVVGAKEQELLYQRHPANIVRLDLNRIQRTDNGDDNRYERARRHLFDWIAQGTVVVDREPTIYIHEQRFTDETGAKFVRRGFISLVRLQDYEDQVVLPHERTLKGPKEDRLELMKATECNLSQIFFLYDDAASQVDELLFRPEVVSRKPAVDICTDDGICHRLWPVADEEVLAKVEAAFEGRPLLIADGHHRYETALAYRNFRRRIADGPEPDAPYEYVMGFLVNIHDPGLQVFPTHRVVHSVEGFDFGEFRACLTRNEEFEVEDIDGALLKDFEGLRGQLEERGLEGVTFAMVSPGGEEGYWVRFVGDEKASFFDEQVPEPVRRLDVTILHDGIFEDLLGIDRADQESLTNLDYVKSWQDAKEKLSAQTTQMVVLMNPTPVEQVNEVCMSGGLMPQKSTYFYPKILSGLAINPL